ncbi:MAG TPA: TetR family transcriptional regulator [Candidatus Eremiobacteraceae bacterium]|nr:TetR family transcriptional regulator [Candidatus Eremiobacteraceae bacterium]
MASFDQRLLTALDAAEAVFAGKGYDGASMRDIAGAAGMSIAGLYYYLPSKQHALELVCERAFGALFDSLDRAVAGAAAPDAKLRAFMRGHLRFVVAHPGAFRVLLYDMDALEGQARSAIQERRRRYFARATELVMSVARSQPSPVSSRVATGALFGMMNWTPMWQHGGDAAEAAAIADQMCELYLRGITPPQATEVVA